MQRFPVVSRGKTGFVGERGDGLIRFGDVEAGLVRVRFL